MSVVGNAKTDIMWFWIRNFVAEAKIVISILKTWIARFHKAGWDQCSRLLCVIKSNYQLIKENCVIKGNFNLDAEKGHKLDYVYKIPMKFLTDFTLEHNLTQLVTFNTWSRTIKGVISRLIWDNYFPCGEGFWCIVIS